MKRYEVSHGTVQCYIINQGEGEFYMHHFGRAEYDRNKPVLTKSLHDQGMVVCQKLNSGEISENEANKILDAIYF